MCCWCHVDNNSPPQRYVTSFATAAAPPKLSIALLLHDREVGNAGEERSQSTGWEIMAEDEDEDIIRKQSTNQPMQSDRPNKKCSFDHLEYLATRNNNFENIYVRPDQAQCSAVEYRRQQTAQVQSDRYSEVDSLRSQMSSGACCSLQFAENVIPFVRHS